jgi:tetratricopeptide (TPR) repeat protein
LDGTGSFEARREEVSAAEESFQRLGDERGLALALITQGDDEWTRCRASAAAEKYRLAIPHGELAGQRSLVDDAISTLCAIGFFGPTHVDDAEHEVRVLLARATGVGAETAAYRALARLAAIRGDFDGARDLIRRGREPLLDAGLLLWHAAACLGAAFVEKHAGDYEAAVRINRDGFAQLAELDEHAFASTVASDLALALLQLGREDEAERWLETARELSPAGDIATLANADIGEGRLQVRRGRVEEGERLVRRGLAQAETTDFWEFRGAANEALAEVLEARGRSDEARAALEAALAVYEAKGATVAAERTRRLLAKL